MSTKNFHTPDFIRMANVDLGDPRNPLVTGTQERNGQIDGGSYREVVLDTERERSHYFDGKLLKARDLLRDQNYLDARLRQAGRAFGAGIIEGLDVGLSDGVLSVRRGIGISPSGRVLELKDESLRAPVDDPALRQELNRGRYGYLSTGLYLVLLSWHEAPSDEIAEVYPREASVQPRAQPDAYDQGVALELMQLPYGLPSTRDELQARAELAGQFLRYGADFPGMPADSLALSLLAVRDNQALWLDETLVRRDYRQEREPHAERLRHGHHFAQLLDDLVRERHPTEDFELRRYFRTIPAMGPLPNAMVDARNQSFTGFPDHYQVSLVPIRFDDIDFLRAQTEHLPPLDLHGSKVERVQILVPLQNASFERLVAALASETESGGEVAAASVDTASSSGYLSEYVAAPTTWGGAVYSGHLGSAYDGLWTYPAAMRFRSRFLTSAAWNTAFSTVAGPVGLYYMRELELSAIQAPQVLPISAGFPTPPEEEAPPEETEPEESPREQPIMEVIWGRGCRDKQAVAAIKAFEHGGVIKMTEKRLRDVLARLDNAYDRFFWLGMSEANNAPGFVTSMQSELTRRSPVQALASIARSLEISAETVGRWKRLAEALGDPV